MQKDTPPNNLTEDSASRGNSRGKNGQFFLNSQVLLSTEYVFSVFYGVPTENWLLSIFQMTNIKVIKLPL